MCPNINNDCNKLFITSVAYLGGGGGGSCVSPLPSRPNPPLRLRGRSPPGKEGRDGRWVGGGKGGGR